MTLEECYNKMTTRFTSNHFGDVAKKHEVLSQLEIRNGAIAGYLRGKNCKRISNRTWEKQSDHIMDAAPYFNPKKVVNESDIFATKLESKIKSVADFLNQLPIESIVNHLTSKGYIVLKP